MKKFLSLVLALIMTMSLVTISAGAKDFTDADEVNYDEAIDVLSALKVVEGYPDESFKPAKTLTRAEAAKIICNMILGPTTAANLSASVAPFSDVAADNWAAGYITYCAQQGIISGYGNGAFGPKDTLTGYQFMKMLLGALGYDAKIEGYVGTNYSVPVAKQALSIGLNKGLKETFNGNDAVTREEACLYALNTLKADLVEYRTSLTVTNGALDTLNVAKAQRWNNSATKIENIKADDYIQFAEQYFPKLELETGNGIYGRPTNVWKLKKTEIGAYTSIEPTYVYTEATENQDVYKDLGKAVIDQTLGKDDIYTWTAFVNGKEVDDVVYPINKDAGKVAKDDDYEYTGNGAVTEIYVDDDAQTVTVCEINYYLGQVSKVKDDTITVKALSKEPKLDDKTFVVDGYEEDDYVVFTVDFNDDEDFVIGEVIEPATVTGEVVRVEKDKDATNGKTTGETYVKLEDGSKHTYSGTNHIVYDLDGTLNVKVHPELTEDYILYLDPNGFVLGFAKAEETVDQYLYVQDADEHLGTWEAKVVLADGTTAKVELKKDLKKVPAKPADDFKDIKNSKGDSVIGWGDNSIQHTNTEANIVDRIWKYSKSDKDVYTLTYVENTALKAAEIHNGKAYITEGVNEYIVDKKTVFVDVDGEKAYTGYKEVPNIEHAEGALVVDKKVGVIVFVTDGDIYDENSTYFMLLKNTRESLKYDDDYYWEYSKAYVNGEKTSLTVAYDADKAATDTVLKTGVLYKALKSIEDGKYITEVKQVALANLPVNAVGDDAFWLTVNPTKTVKYDCDEETVFVLVEYTDKGKLDTISAGNIGDMFTDKDDDGFQTLVSVVKDANDHNTARLVYITYMKPAPAPVAGTLTINGEAVGTYNEGDTFTYTYKATEGKKITAVTGEGFTYTIAADGKSATITGKMTKAGITVTVTEETTTKTFTLTITYTGNSQQVDLDKVVVWKADKTNKFDITKKTAFGKATELTCEVPEGESVYVDFTGKGTTVYEYGPIYEKKTLDLKDLNENTPALTYHKVTVDGVAQMVDAAANAKKVTGLKKNGWYLVDDQYPKQANEDGEYTFETLVEDRTMDSAGVVTDNAKNCTIETLVSNKYAKIGAEITLTLTGSVKIDNNGVVSYVTDTSAPTKITVNGDVTVTDWETKAEFDKNLDDAKKAIKTDGTNTVKFEDDGSITVTVNVASESGTGVMQQIAALVQKGYTVTVTADSTVATMTGKMAADKATIMKLMPTTDGTEKTLTLTVTGLAGDKFEQAVKIKIPAAQA